MTAQLEIPAQNRQIEKLTTPETEKKANKVHAAEKATEIANRIKDARALESALLQKLEFQRDFAAEYESRFSQGARKGNQNAAKNKDARTGVLVSDTPAANWCQAHGFAHRTVQKWCVLIEESVFLEKKNEIIKKCWELVELWQAANFMSESVEWYTPARYLDAVREVLGEIDLDPASNEQANATIAAKHYFSKENDGLKLDWYGHVFMNPPYGKTDSNESLAGAFCSKAVAEYENGNIDACIILINSLHSQSWQAPLYKYAVCFVDHRIQFISGDGDINKSPTFQNIFVYLGKDDERFAKAFQRFGYVMRSIVA